MPMALATSQVYDAYAAGFQHAAASISLKARNCYVNGGYRLSQHFPQLAVDKGDSEQSTSGGSIQNHVNGVLEIDSLVDNLTSQHGEERVQLGEVVFRHGE